MDAPFFKVGAKYYRKRVPGEPRSAVEQLLTNWPWVDRSAPPPGDPPPRLRRKRTALRNAPLPDPSSSVIGALFAKSERDAGAGPKTGPAISVVRKMLEGTGRAGTLPSRAEPPPISAATEGTGSPFRATRTQASTPSPSDLGVANALMTPARVSPLGRDLALGHTGAGKQPGSRADATRLARMPMENENVEVQSAPKAGFRMPRPVPPAQPVQTAQADQDQVPIINAEADRRQAIVDNTPALFAIVNDASVTPDYWRVSYELPLEYIGYDAIIEQEARRQGVDPDLVRAIVYLETTFGWYDVLLEPFDANNSIRPMNVYASLWRGLGYSRDELMDPRTNIRAGVTILRGIQDRLADPSVRKIASIYNFTGAERITEYGARVEWIYNTRRWELADWAVAPH